MKRKVILLPGAGVRKEFYAEVIPALNKHFDVEFLNYSGKTLDEISNNLLNKLLDIKEHFIIIAHCFSGLVMVKALSKKNIDNLDGLVLCNSVADFTHLPPDFRNRDNGEHNTDYKDYDIVLEATTHLMPKEIIENQLNIAINTNVTDYLKNILVPTLVLGSDKDGYFSVNLFEKTHKYIPNADIKIVHGARHLGLLTHFKDYEKCIEQWVEKIA